MSTGQQISSLQEGKIARHDVQRLTVSTLVAGGAGIALLPESSKQVYTPSVAYVNLDTILFGKRKQKIIYEILIQNHNNYAKIEVQLS